MSPVRRSWELTIQGVTNTVEVPLDVAIVDDVAVVTGTFDVTFSDYDVRTPSGPIVLSVEDTGIVELQLYLTSAQSGCTRCGLHSANICSILA